MNERPAPDGRVADAVGGNWVDAAAPPWSRPFLRLSRADRPIGTWLLLLPCWWGALLAAGAAGRFGWHEAWIMAGCAAGAWLMRGAGCTWNDIVDRELDAGVARTASRPIPSGQVSVRAAAAWACLQSLAALAVLLTFPPLAVGLGAASLALVAAYPFAKRFTWWPQAFLGLAFNWGALLAWAAVDRALAPPALALYCGGIAWTLFYDTIYACQDREDDALVGIRSSARRLGGAVPRFLRLAAAVAALLLALAAAAALAGRASPGALAAALAGALAFWLHLARQSRRLGDADPETCLRLFRSNRDAGLTFAALLAAALAL